MHVEVNYHALCPASAIYLKCYLYGKHDKMAKNNSGLKSADSISAEVITATN